MSLFLFIGDSLASTSNTATNVGTTSDTVSSIPIISPRKSIRNYSEKPNTGLYEDSYLLHKGRKSYLMISFAKALTWFTSKRSLMKKDILVYLNLFFYFFYYLEISIYFHLESLGQYHSRRIFAYFFIILTAGLIKDFLLTPPSPLPISVLEFILTNLRTSKGHFLNVYFVKLGWLWTFIGLIPFFVFTRFFFVIRSFEKEKQKAIQYSKTQNRKKSVHFREPLEESGEAQGDNQGDPVEQDQVDNTGNLVQSDIQLTQKQTINQFVIQYIVQLGPPSIRLIISTIIWSISVDFFVKLHHSKAACHFTNASM